MASQHEALAFSAQGGPVEMLDSAQPIFAGRLAFRSLPLKAKTILAGMHALRITRRSLRVVGVRRIAKASCLGLARVVLP